MSAPPPAGAGRYSRRLRPGCAAGSSPGPPPAMIAAPGSSAAARFKKTAQCAHLCSASRRQSLLRGMPAALFAVLLCACGALSLSASVDCDLLSPVAAWPAAGKYGPHTINGKSFDVAEAAFGARTFVAAGGFTFEISSGTSNVA